MKAIEITKNGLFLGKFSFDENSGETLKQFCLRVANVNSRTRYELKVSGDIVRTYHN